MASTDLSAIDAAVLRKVDLPAGAPLCDRRASSLAGRLGMPVDQVEDALLRLAALSPPMVKRVVNPRLGEFWFGRSSLRFH